MDHYFKYIILYLFIFTKILNFILVPGVHLAEDVEIAPVYVPNFTTALCPYVLADTTLNKYNLKC